MADLSSVLSAIAADSLLASWNPTVEMKPDYDLKETSIARCCVVPLGIEYRHLARGKVQKFFIVEIGFIKRKKNVNASSLVSDLETIATGLMDKTFSDARVKAVVHTPLYDDEQLRTRNLFQGVLNIRLEELK